MSVDHYTYRVTWSAEDGEHVGLCAEFPSLSWLAKTPEAALKGIRQIVAEAGEHLVAGGWLLLEHGLDQGASIHDLLETSGFVDIETARDLEARDRVTLGRRGFTG